MSAAATAGLVLDAIGAAVLLYGAALRKSWDSADMATVRYDFNPDVHTGLAKQTADSRVGAALLITGFLGQLLAAVGVDCHAGKVVAASAASAALLGGAAVAVWLPWERRVWIRRALANDLWSKRRSMATLWQPILDAYGRRMNQPRNTSETPEAYGRRLLGAERWNDLVGNHEVPEQLRAAWHSDHDDIDSW